MHTFWSRSLACIFVAALWITACGKPDFSREIQKLEEIEAFGYAEHQVEYCKQQREEALLPQLKAIEAAAGLPGASDRPMGLLALVEVLEQHYDLAPSLVPLSLEERAQRLCLVSTWPQVQAMFRETYGNLAGMEFIDRVAAAERYVSRLERLSNEHRALQSTVAEPDLRRRVEWTYALFQKRES